MALSRFPPCVNTWRGVGARSQCTAFFLGKPGRPGMVDKQWQARQARHGRQAMASQAGQAGQAWWTRNGRPGMVDKPWQAGSQCIVIFLGQGWQAGQGLQFRRWNSVPRCSQRLSQAVLLLVGVLREQCACILVLWEEVGSAIDCGGVGRLGCVGTCSLACSKRAVSFRILLDRTSSVRRRCGRGGPRLLSAPGRGCWRHFLSLRFFSGGGGSSAAIATMTC